MLIQQPVSAQAQARPEATAIVANKQRLTYGALEDRSNRLAHRLLDFGCCRADRVALLMPKSPMAIIAMLGVLKADAAYVPLDPRGPAARIARVLEISHSRFVLAAGPCEPVLREVLGALSYRPTIGWLDNTPAPADADFTMDSLATCSTSPPACANGEADIAHILFTSGSTGLPKGVAITHANVLHFLRWASTYFGIAGDDRHSQHPPLQFDLSTFDIFGTLSAGAELHLVDPELNLLPHKLAAFIRESRLTQWFSVPAALNLMAKFDVVRQGDFPHLRRLLFAGEVLPTPTLIYWMRRVPHAQFTNLYGPTEATIASSYYTVPDCPRDPRQPIPIGSACDGEELLVLDRNLDSAPDRTLGDLYIRGAGLSPGYWNDPEKTREVFIPRPGSSDPGDRIYRTGDLAMRDADGLIYFFGRSDSQVKCRGYRVELAEIELAVQALPGLRESAIVAVPSQGFEGSQICCAFVPDASDRATPETLRKGLLRALPGYMVPTRWLRYDALPKNANGKIDRPRLREDFVGDGPGETARPTAGLRPARTRKRATDSAIDSR